MDIPQLNEALDVLEDAIVEFPVGTTTLDDLKPTEEKIEDLRRSLKPINARILTLKAVIDTGTSEDMPEEELNRFLEALNLNTSNYLINTKTLKLCHQSRGIQDIVFKKAGTSEIQEKVKACLKSLFTANDQMALKIEKKKELMKRQYRLKLECQHAIHDYQDFLKEKEAQRNEQLQENDPSIARCKEKVDRAIFKIYLMKRFITNLIGTAMCSELHDSEFLINMLAAHNEVVTFETIRDMVQNGDASSSSSSNASH